MGSHGSGSGTGGRLVWTGTEVRDNRKNDRLATGRWVKNRRLWHLGVPQDRHFDAHHIWVTLLNVVVEHRFEGAKAPDDVCHVNPGLKAERDSPSFDRDDLLANNERPIRGQRASLEDLSIVPGDLDGST